MLRNAGLIIEAALSMREYTTKHVMPNLDYQPDTFLPQTVPAFAATEMMNNLRKKYTDYSRKAVVLNPKNPLDRAVDWEANVINGFRNASQKITLSGVRQGASNQSL